MKSPKGLPALNGPQRRCDNRIVSKFGWSKTAVDHKVEFSGKLRPVIIPFFDHYLPDLCQPDIH